MTLQKAKRIEELRCPPNGWVRSWRCISEIICEEFPDEPQELSGNQFHGIALCHGAMVLLSEVEKIEEVPLQMREKWDT